jgi:hypothetical protein
VRVRLHARADETCPLNVVVRLSVRDANGGLLFDQREQKTVSQLKSDGDVESAWLSCEWFFILPTRQSYGFTATVDPDGPLESTKLVVHDGAMTRTTVPVRTLALTPIEEEVA